MPFSIGNSSSYRNLKRPIISREIESVIKYVPINKAEDKILSVQNSTICSKS